MKKKTNTKNRSKQRSDDGRQQKDEDPRSLPMVQDQLAVPMRLRFVTTANFTGAFSVTPYNLLDAWFVAGTATNAYQLFDFVRVKRVTIRGMGISVSVAATAPTVAPMATVGIEYMGLSAGSLAGGKQKSNSSLGFEEPAFVSLAPDPKSQVAQFQQASTSSIFTIRAVDQGASPLFGAIIDVDVVYRNSGDVNPAAVSSARAGLTPGDLYFGGLDGNVLAVTQARSVFIRRA